MYLNFLLRLIGITLGVVVSAALARTLGPDVFGVYSTLMSAMALLLVIPSRGISQLLTRRLSIAKNNRIREVGASDAYVLVYAVLVMILTVACGAGLVDYGVNASIVGLLLLVVLISAFNENRVAALNVMGRPLTQESIIQLIQPATFCAIYLGAANIYQPQLKVALGALLLAVLFSGLLLRCSMAKDSEPQAPNGRALKFSFDDVKHIVSLSAVGFIGTANMQLGVLILSTYGDPSQVAGIRIAERAATLVGMPLTVLSMVFAPKVASSFSEGRLSAILPRLLKLSGLTAFGAATLGGVLFFYGSEIIGLIYGNEYISLSSAAMKALVVGQVINALSGPVIMMLVMCSCERYAITSQLVALLANIIMMPILIPILGVPGAAISMAASLILSKIVAVTFAMRALELNLVPSLLARPKH